MRADVSTGSVRACVLVLPGGKVRSAEPSHWWQPANLRMVVFAHALRRRLGSEVVVQRVQYRLRGWNSPQRDPLLDADAVLRRCRHRWQPESVVLVGHSMGGRVAAQLAAHGGIAAVVALAPWWAGDKGDVIPLETRLLVLHGTADTWTDPRDSREQTRRASQRGLDAEWVGIEGAGHSMVCRWREWHCLTADFVAEYVASG
ncbi:MAG: alpha/beta fold hydrolase [Mycobacteriaceae bacterium]|nr:alpha/beta fold hydrolase [Mycobacteriaceae bacterium]